MFVLIVMPLALAALAGVYVLVLSGMTPSEYRERALLAVMNRRFEMGEPLAGLRPGLWELVLRKMLGGHVYAEEWREVRGSAGFRVGVRVATAGAAVTAAVLLVQLVS
jgi:transcriptional regulator GlxA family with amidase domain